MNRHLLLLVTTIWSVSSANFSNDIVYEDGFVADFNYDVHENSLTYQELQQQEADAGLGVLGLEDRPPRVSRDLGNHPYDHWILPNPDKTSIQHGHIVKREISDIEESLEVSNLRDHNEDDAMAEALYEEELDYYHYHEAPASDGLQLEESLESYYELDSHEEPVEERAHGVRARQPRDDDDEVEYEEDAVEDAVEDTSSQLSEVAVEEQSLANSLEVRQSREDKKAGNGDASNQAINKRTIRQAAMNYEKALQSAIDFFYTEETKESSLIEKKKREITGALTSDYDGSYTKAEVEAAVESALNEFYGQKIVSRLKRAAYMELDYKRSSRELMNDKNRENMIVKVKEDGDKKIMRELQNSAQDNTDPTKWNYISPIIH